MVTLRVRVGKVFATVGLIVNTVPGAPGMAKLIVLGPGPVALALSIACWSDPAPVAALFVTVKVAAWRGRVRSDEPRTIAARQICKTDGRAPTSMPIHVGANNGPGD